MSTEFYKQFLQHVEGKLPWIWSAISGHVPSELMFSPAVIDVDRRTIESIQNYIKAIYSLSRSDRFFQAATVPAPEVARGAQKQSSAMMSYDFHITPQGPKLIEINTNAALSTYGALLSDFQMTKQPSLAFSLDGFWSKIKTMFETESQLSLGRQVEGWIIADEKPETQKGYAEFLMFRELFQKWGWRAEIADSSTLAPAPQGRLFCGQFGTTPPPEKCFDGIYNRTTDFYFEHPVHKPLRDAYLSGQICVTPNPKEYARLADKGRLVDFSSREWLLKAGATEAQADLIVRLTSTTKPISGFAADTPKEEKKKWFFKPARSFGSKAAYRGATMSNRMYLEILGQDYIAQEMVDPPTTNVEVAGKPLEFKWDLRCYAYQDRPLLWLARLYQGQATNTNTLGGGLAAVRIVS